MFVITFLIGSTLIAVPDRPKDAPPKDTWVGKVVFVKSSIGNLDTADEPRGLQPNADEGTYLSSNQYRVYAERAEYVQIKTRDGVSGWVRKADLVRLEDAAQFFSNQIAADPTDSNAYHRRASAWRFRGEFELALKDMNEAIRLAPTTVAYNNRGLVWHAKGDFDKAIADYNLAIDGNPGNSLTYVNRANTWLAKKDWDKAIADATSAIAEHPRYPEAHRIRGVALFEKREYDKAIADFNRAVEIDTKHAQALAERANAWAAKNMHAKADADFEQALRLEQNNVFVAASAALWLASCSDSKYRDGKRASTWARHAQSLERSNSLALQALAAAYAELGQLADAVHWQEHALQDPQLKSDPPARARLESYRKLQSMKKK